MKEYRLTGWPQLPSLFDRTAYRRMLSDMSHRHVTLAQLGESSGVGRQQVRAFIDMLEAHGLVSERGAPEPRSMLAIWLRRAWATGPAGH